MLMSSKETKSMVWHGEKNNNDEVMRHPRDPEAWKTFDLRYLNFASDPQNVWLTLEPDGFNDFGNLGNGYSIWLLVLILYNTPPRMCMKKTNFIFSNIILGKLYEIWHNFSLILFFTQSMSHQNSSHMEPQQTFDDSINDEHSLHDCPHTNRKKREYWMVQVKSNSINFHAFE